MAKQKSDKKKTDLDLYIVARVKEMRLQRNWTQSVLATKLDLSDGFYSEIENPNHRAKFNIAHLIKLGKAFECSPCIFLPKEEL
ncbi:helix-turn-helix domain-containing protein [Mucilaginibacter ginsenosidivorax]|uniref:Helix-turn-helix transcriptional regulator n=1 Tax=Mucilaginibacter ginsenosidivorax TaxID=862126 RepID=A0A5B8WA12_9SPHI|nr:helix-turn-helix transcriptional regulator [Mucilaginibacter ginsenosidivorax]QEC79702.1 helix-turn-helix transcriptional regulator [Mucilaginibacter ginsenosidivorax]